MQKVQKIVFSNSVGTIPQKSNILIKYIDKKTISKKVKQINMQIKRIKQKKPVLLASSIETLNK